MNSIPQLISNGEWTTFSARETFELGIRFGGQLSGGEIILLDGPLGAGKTVFAKGIARALDFDEEQVTSPSFTLVNHYQGRLLVYHIDLYRLDQGATAAHAVDLDEILSDEKAVIMIEWGERLGRYPLPANVWYVGISGDGDEPRKILIRRK
jgi:tRNA threonylcarbamoyladenosine biosynthesis protein TsaE